MSGINNYFSNNNIFNGTEIPTQGKFDVGDIVVNIGENAEEEPMWMCIEAGEPGVWKVVGKVEDIDLSGYQEKTDENLVTESKDLVGAINELFQSANNGKELIANAIGEPLSSEDTFSAMSSDINGLLSTFKTNMMNNGVTVESNDKFKSLIDKIATLVDSEGKGVQFVVDVARTNEDGKLYVSGLPFKPIFFLTYLTDPVSSLSPDTRYYNLCFNIGDITTSVRYNNGTFQNYSSIDSITDDGFIASVYHSYNHWDSCGYEHTYYVIGVGEEDTTLRDSLASILQEEGVNVTEEDDMASLISKVDEEFDRKNANSGLDIISATELPATGKENQICIITDNPVSSHLVSSNFDDKPSDENSIFVYEDSLLCPKVLQLGTGTVSKRYINTIYQGNRILESYVYQNGVWNQLTDDAFTVILNSYYNSEALGDLVIPTKNEYGDNLYLLPLSLNNNGLGVGNFHYCTISCVTTNQIDFNKYSKARISYMNNILLNKYAFKLIIAENSKDHPLYGFVSSSNVTGAYSGCIGKSAAITIAQNTEVGKEITVDVDISGFTNVSELRLVFFCSSATFGALYEANTAGDGNVYFQITKIELY